MSKVVDRVQALIRLATDGGTSDNEARAAAFQACRLINKNDLMLIGKTSPPPSTSQPPQPTPQPPAGYSRRSSRVVDPMPQQPPGSYSGWAPGWAQPGVHGGAPAWVEPRVVDPMPPPTQPPPPRPQADTDAPWRPWETYVPPEDADDDDDEPEDRAPWAHEQTSAPDGTRNIICKHGGRCRCCGVRVSVGQAAVWARGKGITHAGACSAWWNNKF